MTKDPAERTGWRGAAALSLGVLALSSAAILFRASDAPALTTAMWRVALSALLLAPLASLRGRGEPIHVPATLIAGVALGLHFWTWMLSLQRTSVASSTLFVTTTPFWVALAARWLPYEQRPTRRTVAGMAISFTGGALIAVNAGSGDAHVSLDGIALATVGAWLAAAYLVAGRVGRQTMSLARFAFGANAVAAFVLLILGLATGTTLLGWSPQTWILFLALAAVPQLIGHNALLWAVRSVGAAIVALAVLTEPVGATLLAWAIFDESPRWFELVGGALLLIGLAVAVSRAANHVPSHPEEPKPT